MTDPLREAVEAAVNPEEIKARWDAATPGPWSWWMSEAPPFTFCNEQSVNIGITVSTIPDAEAVASAPTDIRALLDELDARDRVPEGWVVNAEFPADRYFVRREGDTFVMYCEDDHGAFS